MKQKIIVFIGYVFLSLLYKLNKYKIYGKEYMNEALSQNRPILLCVWHGRMLFPIFYVIMQKMEVWALASPHKDGDTLGKILSKWGVQIIKGSSNQQPHIVIEKMHQILKNDKNAIICITNDGPKGPRHVAKKKSLEIAKQYNAQIISVSGDSTKKWVFNTWDKFYLPKPFGKITINISPIYKYQPNLDESVSKFMINNELEATQKSKND
tara:strand:+ start:29209 stop:29838 length:630 start_codon:yes stop_codon:yes gene_type:complete